ncbi:deleted in malignant brain tumors 1 protein-like [Haliotis rufescens]|uniref:deleted in malignant brain tumors 1 protein-like n=1 Tax=Haliotis rufescens TaxID=6454 RepID=UPI00201EBC89|nr:deleted in malignant brain tumors 1 protein-like [Haliotis rufescens]
MLTRRRLFSKRLSLWAALITSFLFVCSLVVGRTADADCMKRLRVSDTLSYAIRSEGYPNGYEQNKECWWELNMTSMFQQNKTIKLQFDVDIEDSRDCIRESVTVYAFTSPENTTLAVLCGRIENRTHEFFIPYILVVFRSGSVPSQEKQGFKMAFQMIDGTCHKELDSNDKTFRSVYSKNYPQPYPSFQRCTYLIRAGTRNESPVLTFTFTGMGYYCNKEYILVYDGDSEQGPLLMKLCRYDTATLRSLLGSLYLVFVSHDNSIHHIGFKARAKDAMCGEVLTARIGRNRIFKFGKAYPINHPITCEWQIKTDRGYKVLVSFRGLAVDCKNSRITVHDGKSTGLSNDEGSWDICGQKKNYTFMSSGNHISFKLNSQGQAAQPVSFSIKFIGFVNKACYRNENDIGGDIKGYLTAEDIKHTLTSPGYPDLYPDRIECVWQMQADTYLGRVRITVVEMDLHTEPECYDSISYYHGIVSDLDKKPDMILCNNMTSTFVSESQFITIVFSTNEYGIGKGFKLDYQTIEDEVYYSEDTDTAKIETSSGAPVAAISCVVVGVIVIVIVAIYCYTRSKRQPNLTPQPLTVPVSQYPNYQGRESAAPFLQTSTPTHTLNPSAPPPMYTDLTTPPVSQIPQHLPLVPPPSYHEAISQGMIEKASDTAI